MDEITVVETREVAGADTRQRVIRWAEEGQYLLRQLPGVFSEHERVRARTEAAEQESERLRQEIGEIAEAFRKLLNEVLHPMNEALQRLRVLRRSPLDS